MYRGRWDRPVIDKARPRPSTSRELDSPSFPPSQFPTRFYPSPTASIPIEGNVVQKQDSSPVLVPDQQLGLEQQLAHSHSILPLLAAADPGHVAVAAAD